VQAGEVIAQREFDPSVGTLALELPKGRYELYVNDRFTGRIVDLPADRGDVPVQLTPAREVDDSPATGAPGG
jgi:hypothetical protein